MSLVSLNDLVGQPKEEVEKLIAEASNLSQLYDSFVSTEKGDGHLRAPGIHASEIAGCERRIYYNILGTPQSNSVTKNMRQRFQIGKALHSMLQADFHALARNSGGTMQFESEVPINPLLQEVSARLNIHSSCDGVFTFLREPYTGPIYLRVGLEIKTEAPDNYEKLQAPKPEHIEQAHVYMRCLDLPLMYFMYVNKGNQNNTPSIHPYLIQFDPVKWDEIEQKCIRILQMAKDGTPPDRKESYVCTFCPFSRECQPSYLQPKFSKQTTATVRWKSRRP